jgi:hypothetical protein
MSVGWKCCDDRKDPKRMTRVGVWVVAMADSGQKSTSGSG